MTAATQVPTRTCETCGATFERRRNNETRAAFATRRYCRRGCATAARRTQPAKPPKPVPSGLALRYVDGVWRPNAYGWPDQPVIPAHQQVTS